MSPADRPDLASWRSRVESARRGLVKAEPTEEYVEVVDELVCWLGSAAGWDRDGRAIVAQGGYGRRQLAARSDLDLLFIVRRGGERPPLEEVLYPLWDLGFDVGHALRTPKECTRMVLSDLTAATALLDARLLLGDDELYRKARDRAGLGAGGSKRLKRWVPSILGDVEDRRLRFGEVSHLLEPHIKEGKGGLRDLQACRWVLACLGEAPDEVLLGLPNGGEILEAEAFLNRTRNVLHVAADRKTDHLTFDHHADVASAALPGSTLSAFFERLHRSSHAIVAAWEEVAASAREGGVPRPGSQPEDARLTVTGLSGRLEHWCRSEGTFPSDLRRTLRHADRTLLSNAVREAFSRLLHERVPLAPLLMELHSRGALGLLTPALERVAHQVHYDARHAFTTAVHCIETLRAFDDLWLGRLEGTEPYLSRVAASIVRPAATRLAALCHDLGKAHGVQGHAPAGAAMARELATSSGLGTPEAGEVEALVTAHHVIPDIAFGEDLEDPASWEAVRGAAGTPARLDALVALAYADLAATNPSVGSWNDWRRDLILTLHSRAQGAGGPGDDRQDRVRRLPASVAPSAGAIDFGEIWDRIPPREAVQVPPELLARLLELAGELGERPASWHVEVGDDGDVEILGVTLALPKLLSSSTGALTALGFNILAFQVHTWSDGTVHLWLRGGHPGTPPAAETIATALTEAVTGASPPRVTGGTGLKNRRGESVPVETRLRLSESENPFYSVLEIRCRDRRGLMHDLTAVFERLGLTVEYALVTTAGPVAQDVFHLKDIFGGRIEGKEKTRTLLARIEEVIRSEQGTLPTDLTNRGDPAGVGEERSTP